MPDTNNQLSDELAHDTSDVRSDTDHQDVPVRLDTVKMLRAINEMVSGDWGYSVTDDMVSFPDGKPTFRHFTQEQAVEMSNALSRVYLVAHAIHCEACQRKWLTKATDLSSEPQTSQRASTNQLSNRGKERI